MTSCYSEILSRIAAAIEEARAVFSQFTPGAIQADFKAGHDPVTEADRALDAVLRKSLLREGEGWLSEESVDDISRLERSRVWVVDPLDGTREFVQGIPEFCVGNLDFDSATENPSGSKASFRRFELVPPHGGSTAYEP